MGTSLPEKARQILFIILPVLLIVLLLVYYFKAHDISSAQRWFIAGIIGGGAGNLIDRIFRPAGVVDFISIKFFGILGFERWPTFNAADASVVVCVIGWFITVFVSERRRGNS
jgi:signal peptidase II